LEGKLKDLASSEVGALGFLLVDHAARSQQEGRKRMQKGDINTRTIGGGIGVNALKTN